MQQHVKFNVKQVQSILQRENDFISDILRRLPIPASSIQRGMNEDDYVTVSEQSTSDLTNGTKKTNRAKSLEELQNRFQELKGKKTLHYKEKLVKKGLKNRLKKHEKKLKHKQNKINKKQKPNPDEDSDQKPTIPETSEETTKPQKPIFNSQGKMVFSKFDFHEGASIFGGGKSNNKKQKKNDPQTILKNLQEQNDKLKELKSTGEKDKAEELKQSLMWKSALAKAGGEKVKDDPDLLKKTIKKREQQVRKSKNKWKQREEGVQKAKDDRQKKRTENIQKRKKDKKMTRLKKASKKGKIIPGF